MPTWAGFVFLAVVLDVFSRRIVEWSMADPLRTELVLEALNMAVGQRRPEAVIHRSDQGTQYTSLAFGKRCREMGVRPSTCTNDLLPAGTILAVWESRPLRERALHDALRYAGYQAGGVVGAGHQ